MYQRCAHRYVAVTCCPAWCTHWFVQVGGATATGRGAGRNVARPETVLRLLGEGAAGGVNAEQRAAFAQAKGLLLQQLAKAQGRGLAQGQLSAAA